MFDDPTNKRRRIDQMVDINIDNDDILNLEEEYYKKGYLEGQEQSAQKQFLEGKEYGYQTGFQRFLIVGFMKGLIQHWESDESALSSTVLGHVAKLKEMVDEIPTTNGDEDVAKYDQLLSKARNKLRVIATLTKSSWMINKLDSLVKEVSGQLQVNETLDDMW